MFVVIVLLIVLFAAPWLVTVFAVLVIAAGASLAEQPTCRRRLRSGGYGCSRLVAHPGWGDGLRGVRGTRCTLEYATLSPTCTALLNCCGEVAPGVAEVVGVAIP